ncbi:zinc-binding dehydrogenase domain-containing protein [Rhizoctonia solani AG-1 IA]|uniref:Zinc-binding dehydrogenase domain-containing protein n=1 Tax=Thanatephorus cucumeris (strain AG1-IA) TaxID=983506 RepID=L8WSB8_THACA|nr:zinc-binding dehydrogenase domain-containing protein [Rhizoctonia solani AG-1 IA]
MADVPTVAQAWRFPVDQNTWKGHQSLQLQEVKLPPPGKGEVLVRLYAAALNYSNRTYPASPTDSTGPDGQGLIPTSDGAGEVVALGDGVTQWKKGDRVIVSSNPLNNMQPEHDFQALGAGTPGCLAQYRVFKAETLLPIPDYLSYEEASTLPCAALTAWNSFFERKPVTDKSTVLVLGSGGVSVFGAQLAKAAGARVIATTSSEAKAQKYRALGVDEVVNYREHPEWSAKVKELTGGKGVEQVIGSTQKTIPLGGQGTIFQSIKSIERGGMIHVIGAVASGTSAGGGVQELGTLILITPAVVSEATIINVRTRNMLMNWFQLSGVLIGSKAMCQRLDAFVAKHKIKPVIDRVFGWTEVIEAFDYQISGSHFGKVVIKIE